LLLFGNNWDIIGLVGLKGNFLDLRFLVVGRLIVVLDGFIPCQGEVALTSWSVMNFN
jgi:hypothetical protein